MDYTKLYGDVPLSEAAKEHREFYEDAVANALADDDSVMRYEASEEYTKPKYKEPSVIAKYGLDKMGLVLDPDGETYVAYNPSEYQPKTDIFPIDRMRLRQFLRDLLDAV
jgi:hypothetical protein